MRNLTGKPRACRLDHYENTVERCLKVGGRIHRRNAYLTNHIRSLAHFGCAASSISASACNASVYERQPKPTIFPLHTAEIME